MELKVSLIALSGEVLNMLENLDKETGNDCKANEPDRLSQQAWEPKIVADGSSARVPTAKDAASEEKKEAQGKKPDAFKEHVQVNDRCSLDIYEHHWELTMPKVNPAVVNIPEGKQPLISVGGLILNSQGKFELEMKGAKELVTKDKLIMDDKGVWTMKDEEGQSAQRLNQGIVSHSLDPKHPEIKTELKQKEFDNGAFVMIENSGQMVLIRDHEHKFVSKKGTPEYTKERRENRLIVGFSKEKGVTSVYDQGKVWPIKRQGDSR